VPAVEAVALRRLTADAIASFDSNIAPSSDSSPGGVGGNAPAASRPTRLFKFRSRFRHEGFT